MGIDDVFDSGNSVKAILETFRSMARKNTPEMRTACLYYKPTANQVDIVPNYWLHETEAWLVFPHELEGLTLEEIGQKWDPEIAEIVQAPGGPFAKAGEKWPSRASRRAVVSRAPRPPQPLTLRRAIDI